MSSEQDKLIYCRVCKKYLDVEEVYVVQDVWQYHNLLPAEDQTFHVSDEWHDSEYGDFHIRCRECLEDVEIDSKYDVDWE